MVTRELKKFKRDTIRKSILEENKFYSFSDFFKLPYPIKAIITEFGYT
jgi:hypothetical protein